MTSAWRRRTAARSAISEVKNVFHDAYAKIVAGEMEDDGFNRLVLLAHLDWREISVLRAYAKYLRQAGIAFSQIYMEEALAHNARLARRLVRLFRAMFNPAKQATAAERARINEQEILKGLDAVTNLDEDRILRRFLNLIQSTLRTNFFQRGKDYISFKLDSQALEELPLPRPLVEIWVYSPRVEAVHLRGGKVARGGIRWSDRREDFRTEVLSLMKAQMVKNAVIVPGRLQGRLRGQAPAARRRARGALGRGHRMLQDHDAGAAGHHRQSVPGQGAGRREMWCAATRTIPIWWWRPTRARRPSPTSPMPSPPNTTSGSATPSPPAARRAMTIRRWRSPPGAPGNR